MNNSAFALLLYGTWSLTLLFAIMLLRGVITASGRRAPNDFLVSGEDVSPFSGRLCRAHANCYESLPAFAAILLVAITSGHAEITDSLALWAILARVCQSSIHLCSSGKYPTMVRYSMQSIQVAIQAVWVIGLLKLAPIFFA
ncbi:MAG: MAPEG family protein [Undibacterium sp.]|nr:MAPEG family protein [Undibacterium sp.]